MKHLPLAGITILNTRPQLQALELASAINQLGGISINLPTVTIVPLTVNYTVAQLKLFDMLIFMSSNAVSCSPNALLAAINTYKPAIGAVGAMTTATLSSYGINATIVPTLQNSEGLLAMPILHRVTSRNILIIRGQYGRTLLDDILQQRGAVVTEMCVYKRQLPQNFQKDLIKNQALDIILCTSIESMRNLFILLGEDIVTKLKNITWLCISERIATQVHAKGIKHIIVAEKSNLLQTLCTWAKNYKDLAYGKH